MNFVKSETLYLSENELDIIRRALNFFDTIEDKASSPEIRETAKDITTALRNFYESDFIQPAEVDPNFWQQNTESEEYARGEDIDWDNPCADCDGEDCEHCEE